MPDGIDLERLVGHWQQTPCTFVSPSVLTAEEALIIASRAAETERSRGENNTRVYSGGRFVFEPRQLRFLTVADDRSLIDYIARVHGALGAFAVNYRKVHSFMGWPLWNRIAGLLSPLFRRVGLPYGGVEASLVVGQEESITPALFTVGKKDLGTRSGYLIHCVFGATTIDTPDRRLVLQTGDLAYLPANEQITAKVEVPTAALVLTMRSSSREERVFHLIQQLLLEHREHNIESVPHTLQQSLDVPASLPAVLEETWAQVRQVTSSPRFERLLLAAWLRFETGLGFLSTPRAEKDRAVDASDSVRAGETFRWFRLEQEVLVSANGHALTLPASQTIELLLEAVGSLAPLPVSELVERFSSEELEEPLEPDDVMHVLRALASVHAIAVLPTAAP